MLVNAIFFEIGQMRIAKEQKMERRKKNFSFGDFLGLSEFGFW